VRDLVTPARVEGTVALADGRRLGFAEWGPADGRPVVWMHGTPGARRQVPQSARAAAAARGLRIVCFDRPGVGASTPHLYGSLTESVDDLVQLLDALGVDRFAAVGLSGGGPYVLAAAHGLPDRVVVAGVLGGLPPMRDPAVAAGGTMSRFAGLATLTARVRVPFAHVLGASVRALRPLGSPMFDVYARFSPEGDQRVFSRPEVKAVLLDDLETGARGGFGALVDDFVVISRPWGFSLRDVRVPVRWWHGDADSFVPLDVAQRVVALLPDAELTVRPGESHLGTLGAADEVLEVLMGVWGS
jgi:pimeloyl-ACP methyl ester carboxylesterase